MKILLLGEYSNLHWTLAQGLRQLGHNVTVASGGDSFKNYNRNINLNRDDYGIKGTVRYVYDIFKHFRSFKGYDVVQIINPFFLDLRADRNLDAFKYLKKHNGKVVMGAFGDDSYWLKTCLDKKTFRYSEFDIPGRNDYTDSAKHLIKVWSDKDKVRVNQEIAERADGIIACLYEYYVSYKKDFSEKLIYISEPVDTSEIIFKRRGENIDRITFFIGIQKHRSEIKGTDVMLKVLKEIHSKYPDTTKIITAESVPYNQYIRMMGESDILLDQLYSYTPGMNALAAMAQGLVVVGGGEPEMYDLLGEGNIKPIVNVIPIESDIFNKLESLVLNSELIPDLSVKSREFIDKHHDYLYIALQYVNAWDKFA